MLFLSPGAAREDLIYARIQKALSSASGVADAAVRDALPPPTLLEKICRDGSGGERHYPLSEIDTYMLRVMSRPGLASTVGASEGEEMEMAGAWAAERKKKKVLSGADAKVPLHHLSIQS
jgi:hypothetical protein